MNKVLLVTSLPWTSKLAWKLMMESKTAGLELAKLSLYCLSEIKSKAL